MDNVAFDFFIKMLNKKSLYFIKSKGFFQMMSITRKSLLLFLCRKDFIFC